MGLARDAILWAADNPTLRRTLPRVGVVRRSVRRFMPGETLDAALAEAERFDDDGVPSTFTRLGENLTDLAEADGVADHYAGAYARIGERGLDVEISVKLTQLGLDIDVERTERHVRRLAELAAAQGRRLWFDMESSPYVGRTLDLYRRVRGDGLPVGVCLQAYLRRTAEDVASLIPLAPMIRFVKGAYNEPAELLVGDRAAIDRSYHDLAVGMLSATDDPRALALGTHDVDLIRRIEVAASALGRDRSSFEVQMLFGIRAADLDAMGREGYRIRPLVAYGEHWYPWFMRRLAERPANVLIAARNLLG